MFLCLVYFILLLVIQLGGDRVDSQSIKHYIPKISIIPFSDRDINKNLHSYKNNDINFNLDYASQISSLRPTDPPPEGFTSQSKCIVCGTGKNDFLRASNILRNFSMINGLSWAKVVSLSPKSVIERESIIATVVKCYNVLWSFNPCKVITATYDVEGTSGILPNGNVERVKQSEISFATLHGHLISGAERFRVVLHADNRVTFEMFSFTKGAGLLGKIAMPFIRPLQRQFFNDQAKLFLKLLMDNAD